MWSNYDPTEINGARGGRKLPTLVLGNPFPGPQEAVAGAPARSATSVRIRPSTAAIGSAWRAAAASQSASIASSASVSGTPK
jgi:hypothetical protein